MASSLNTCLHSTSSCEAGQNQLSLLQKKGNGPLCFHLLPSSSLTLSYLSLPPTSSLSHSSTSLIHCPPGWGLPGEAAFHNVQAFPLHLEVSQQAAYTLLLRRKKKKKSERNREKAPHSTTLSQPWQTRRHFQSHSTKCISQSWKTTHFVPLPC